MSSEEDKPPAPPVRLTSNRGGIDRDNVPPVDMRPLPKAVNERNLKEIRIPPEIAPEAMETLLDYFYSGELALSQSNIESVFRATDYMRLDTLLEISIKHLKETLNPSNCVQCFLLAETIEYLSSRLQNLKKASSALIVSEVEAVSQREDFLNLSSKHITKILKYNNQPEMVESLYWVILKWVSHNKESRQQFLYDFLQTLPVEGFSKSFVTSEMRNEELLRRDLKSILWVMDAMSRLPTNSLTQNRSSSFLFVDRTSPIQKCFLVKKVTPKAIHDRPKIDSFSAVSYKKRIYLLCGKGTKKSYQLNEPHGMGRLQFKTQFLHEIQFLFRPKTRLICHERKRHS